MAELAKVLIAGEWRAADAEGVFYAENPATGEQLEEAYPVSSWADCELALDAAVRAAVELRSVAPGKIAAFLELYAAKIEAAAETIVAAAHEETGLPVAPRLSAVELPRTTGQLRQAAAAAREESWKRATLDTKLNIQSYLAPLGPVVVFGPNNFPLAFNGISGGDFAAAIAAGNPVIAKAHPLHPTTTRLLAAEARAAAAEVGLPVATVQLLYNVSNANGLKLVSDARVGATGFTGSRPAGLHLKRAAEEAGKPIYLELSSINPVIFMRGALAEGVEKLVGELADSCLAGVGQFCTSPNLILLWAGEDAESFVAHVAKVFSERAAGALLSAGGLAHVASGVEHLLAGGAELVTGGKVADGAGYRYANTLLRATGKQFLAKSAELEREVFGNATLVVTVADLSELQAILALLEGNLTGSVYSAQSGVDDEAYAAIEPLLRVKVGRLMNDKMPTGVAVSAAMNHGGPFPAASHPGFTSVGIPASLTRFAALQCFDGVRQDRLPAILRTTIANAATWRSIDGNWVKGEGVGNRE